MEVSITVTIGHQIKKQFKLVIGNILICIRKGVRLFVKELTKY